jgi:hypothetical protein
VRHDGFFSDNFFLLTQLISVYLEVADECEQCITESKAKEERRAAAAQRKREYHFKKASDQVAKLQELYKEDRYVVCHNVHYALSKGGSKTNVDICKASFIGQVRHSDIKVGENPENGHFEVACQVTVGLIPRKDINFRDVLPCNVDVGLSLTKNMKGFCMVKLSGDVIRKRNDNVVIGTRCSSDKKGCPDEEGVECPSHGLRGPIVLAGTAAATLAGK